MLKRFLTCRIFFISLSLLHVENDDLLRAHLAQKFSIYYLISHSTSMYLLKVRLYKTVVLIFIKIFGIYNEEYKAKIKPKILLL